MATREEDSRDTADAPAARRVLVTGGSRGIGLAVAAAFGAQDAQVIATARGEEALQKAMAGIGPEASGIRCDNADTEDIRRTVDIVWAQGGLDVLVNNAGISPFYKRAEHVTPEEFDMVATVNLRGTYFFSTEVAKRWLAEGREGCIVNITSALGVASDHRLSAYSAVKAGLNHLTKVLALEWADRRIRVNAVAPGWTETDFTEGLFASRHAERLLGDIPMGRWGRTGDVAGAVLYLAGETSGYVTGTVLLVDGGRVLR
ncbi:MAG TPA: glucose 1-dehydrogenase [Dehalococcoidia bacterium]|nr:glucose 1-dehydrogenase [Dehalococcoidia bacterium]